MGGQLSLGSPIQAALKLAWKRLSEHPLARVGPGLITGVADDDPSGIATYSQAGAQFGLNMLWTMPLAYPLMAAIQSMCARIGRVTGKGLGANIKETFPPYILLTIVAFLLFANIFNIAADMAAMGEATQLVTGWDMRLMTMTLAIGTLLMQIFIPYHRYVYYLKWLTLSLLAYAAVLFTIHVPWKEVALRTLWPHLELNAETAIVVTGVFGTTISPYLFFWQASEEIEDMQARRDRAALLSTPAQAGSELRRIKWDTWSGMFYSNIASYFIILTTAVTLHVAGVTDIQTAAQAAGALKPLAGEFAFVLFALGILGVGLIGVPVLAGSAGYVISEAMGWKWGLERQAKDARGFYGVIAISILGGLLLEYTPISPMKALFWSAVINGVVAVPLIMVVIVLASRKTIMGAYPASRLTIWLGWAAAGAMGLSVIMMFMPGG